MPALVQWMLDGGTRHYDRPARAAATASGSPRDPALAWLESELAA